LNFENLLEEWGLWVDYSVELAWSFSLEKKTNLKQVGGPKPSYDYKQELAEANCSLCF